MKVTVSPSPQFIFAILTPSPVFFMILDQIHALYDADRSYAAFTRVVHVFFIKIMHFYNF